jgi:hypothetical protein
MNGESIVLFRNADEVTGRPKLRSDKWILYHDNVPEHDVLRDREFLAKKSITKMGHPPYSPDLVPCNFWLFPKCHEETKFYHCPMKCRPSQ